MIWLQATTTTLRVLQRPPRHAHHARLLTYSCRRLNNSSPIIMPPPPPSESPSKKEPVSAETGNSQNHGSTEVSASSFQSDPSLSSPTSSPETSSSPTAPERRQSNSTNSSTAGSDPSTASTSRNSPPVFAGVNLEQLKSRANDLSQDLKSRTNEWTSLLRMRANVFSDKTIAQLSQLGSRLNQVTGYDVIETLKKEVVEQEAQIESARAAARAAKIEHEAAVARRAASQKEVNDLLSRKSSWSDADVVRFTALVREDHTLEQALAEAHTEVGKTEDAVERAFSSLMQAILARYHEEQVWSDKIRSVSTYGSLTALGLNLVVFILAIIIVEPWKRKRMTEAFEKRVDEMMKDTQASTQAGLHSLEEALKKHETALAAILASSESSKRMMEAAIERKEVAYQVPVVVASAIPSLPDPSPSQPTEHPDRYRQWMDRLQNTDATTAGSVFAASVIGWLAHYYFGK